MKILIVEDEPHAQAELKRILKKVAPDFDILACCDGIASSVSFLESQNPDLIFMDIQLSDGQSFEIFSRVSVKCPVIFTTAYDAYALQAFRANGIDYLLKPIEPDDIARSIEKFRMIQASGAGEPDGFSSFHPEVLRNLLNPAPVTYKNRFMANVGDRIRFLTESEVAYFQADDEVVYMVGHDRKKLIINYTLEALEPQLNPATFFRINRRYILHIDAIGEIHKHFNSRLKLNIQPPPDEEVMVSRARVPAFLNWIGQ